jgi:hypothetical protein
LEELLGGKLKKRQRKLRVPFAFLLAVAEADGDVGGERREVEAS